jgi:hypothetical protein
MADDLVPAASRITTSPSRMAMNGYVASPTGTAHRRQLPRFASSGSGRRGGDDDLGQLVDDSELRGPAEDVDGREDLNANESGIAGSCDVSAAVAPGHLGGESTGVAVAEAPARGR